MCISPIGTVSSELRDSVLFNDSWIYVATCYVVLSRKVAGVTIFNAVYWLVDPILIHCYHELCQGTVLAVALPSHRFVTSERRCKSLSNLVNKRIVPSVTLVSTVW